MNLSLFLLLCQSADPTALEDSAGRRAFLEKHCLSCHDRDTAKGGLDLASLPFDPKDARVFAAWVRVHDRLEAGEMPPGNRTRPGAGEVEGFLNALRRPLLSADAARSAAEGRSTWRRLNRYEYENTLRDLLHAPWLQLRDFLPEDGEAWRFNKTGDALDVSHVQMAQYLTAADHALRDVLATSVARPEAKTARYYARDMKNFARRMVLTDVQRIIERATFPVLGVNGQPEVRVGRAPLTVGSADPETREKEAMGVVSSRPFEPTFDGFKVKKSGRYRIRLCAYSIWVGPGKGATWWKPDLDIVGRGRRPEPIAVYAHLPPFQLRRLGAFDAAPDPTISEMVVDLLEGEMIRPDAARLFRSKPPNHHNPLAERDGQPGVAYRWLEVEGPLYDAWPPPGHRQLFGTLPLRKAASGGVDVVAGDSKAEAERLLRAFLRQAYRRPVAEEDVARFKDIVLKPLDAGLPFAEAMIAGYSAALCSPRFLYLEERPGPLDDDALAARLSYFLWNSPPDATLRAVAEQGGLRRPEALGKQTDRLLDDPRSRRFVEAFLDYWLDLRKIQETLPDAELYPDYTRDDFLVESAVEETRLFFAEMLRADLPTRNVVASDFALINGRLAAHYGLPHVEGVAFRRVPIPPDHPRGGLLTQASVLKVTANGTTTSPVRRGAWVMERLLGKPPPPPPADVPAVEPDIRGAVTIRDQLDMHRTLKTCAACHDKIDPAGFALENFDVLGGWRERYRALGAGTRVLGFGMNGQPFRFGEAQLVDAGGELPGGGTFKNVVDLKRLLLREERQLARALAGHLIVFATGAPIRFGDRPHLEAVLDRAAATGYGVRTLVRELVQSDLFRCK